MHFISSIRLLCNSCCMGEMMAFIYLFIYLFSFNWNSLHARLNNHYKAYSYKKKKHKKIKTQRKSVQKIIVKRCLLILVLKPFRSQAKGKHSISKEFQSLAVQGKKLLTQTFVTLRNGDRKIMQSIRIMNRPSSRIRKWNQLHQFR